VGDASPLALIAGAGVLPGEIARSVRARGRRVVAIALHGLAEAELEREVDACEWLCLGEFARMFEALARGGAREVVLAGKAPKSFIWQRREVVKPDAIALGMLAALKDRKDDSLLGAIADLITAQGFSLASQLAVAPELVAPAGRIAGRAPSDAEWGDVEFGFPIARALGGLDVGQSVVVQSRAVLALEAIEGTDAAIARGLGFADPAKPVCVVKVAKPAQDARFDVPAVGPATVRALAACGGTLAVEAGRTLLLGRAELAAEAERVGVAVVGARDTRDSEARA
jgi:DUF1009 family protein